MNGLWSFFKQNVNCPVCDQALNGEFCWTVGKKLGTYTSYQENFVQERYSRREGSIFLNERDNTSIVDISLLTDSDNIYLIQAICPLGHYNILPTRECFVLDGFYIDCHKDSVYLSVMNDYSIDGEIKIAGEYYKYFKDGIAALDFAEKVMMLK